MPIASANLNIGQLQASFRAARAGSELRATTTTLYSKGLLTDFRLGKAERDQRRKDARALIEQALDREFAGLLPIYASAVRKNMATVFQGTGPLTRADLDRVANEVARVKGVRQGFRDSAKLEGLTERPEFRRGKANHRAVIASMPDAGRPADHFSAMECYVALLNKGAKQLTSEELEHMGALMGLIEEMGVQMSDVVQLKRATQALDVARECGATSARVLPEAVPLNHMAAESDRDGRCLVFSTLVALAESRPSGLRGDGVLKRLEQETHAQHVMGARGATTYSRALAAVHGNGTLSDNSSYVFKNPMGHRDIVRHLTKSPSVREGRPTFYGLSVPGHMMMIGATKHGGADSFMFYDPEFGLARFDSAQKLSAFLDRYFGELGYSTYYDMGSGRGGYQISAVRQIDTDALAKVSTEVGGLQIPLVSMTAPAAS